MRELVEVVWRVRRVREWDVREREMRERGNRVRGIRVGLSERRKVE